MNPDRYQQIKEILLEALESEDVAAVLQKHCGDDIALRNEVEELLKLDVGETFLAQSPVKVEVADTEQELLDGQLGRIRINEVLARGGMGDIYSGTDEVLGRPVAIKIIKSELRISAAKRWAFLNEAKILSSLQHPNICQVYDFFEDRDKDVLVLELIEGTTLRQLLDEKKEFNALAILLQISNALVAAHERGIMHHDLKPENVMITNDGTAKVLDFGLARSERLQEKIDSDISQEESSTKLAIAGTPGYMSPEQAKGETSNTASDIWSLGLIAIELLSGNKALPSGRTTLQLIELARQGTVEIPTNLSKSQARLLSKMLKLQPQARCSAREVLTELESIQNQPKRRIAVAIAASLVVITGLSAWRYTTDLQFERAIADDQRTLAEEARFDAENLIGFMLDELNTSLQSVGRLDILESVADQALAYYGGLNQDQMQDSKGNPAVAMMQIAEVLDFQGRKEDALALLGPAEMALQSLHQEFPDDELVIARLGNVHMVTGNIHKIAGEFEAAHTHLDRGVELGETITQGISPGTSPTESPSALERWRLLLRSKYLSADTYMRQGQLSFAAEGIEEAYELAAPALQVEPLLSATMADIQFKRCDVFFDSGFGEQALEACLAILQIDGDLYKANPENFQLLLNFALDHIAVVRVYERLERFEEGLELISAGESLYRRSAVRDEANTFVLNELALILGTKARLLFRMNRLEESQLVFQEAYSIMQPLVADQEETTYMNTLFPILLHLGHIDEAQEVASTLMERGFRRREFLDLCNEFEISECRN